MVSSLCFFKLIILVSRFYIDVLSIVAFLLSISVQKNIVFSEIAETVGPRHRFMSAYEQKVEPPDRKWQYLLFAAEPYETISFKVLFPHVVSVKVVNNILRYLLFNII